MSKIINKFFLIVFLSFLFSCNNTGIITKKEKEWLKNRPNLVVGLSTNAPPYQFVDEEGEISGIFIDFLTIVENRLDYKFKKKYQSDFSKLLLDTQEGTVDILLEVQATEERLKFLNFTPHLLSHHHVIVVKNSENNIENIDDLKTKNIAVVNKYAVQEYLSKTYPDLKLLPLLDDVACLRSVSTGQADAFICQQAVATFYIENEGISNLKIVGEIKYSNELAIGSRKSLDTLNTILTKAVNSISNIEKQEIYNTWLSYAVKPFYLKTKFLILVFIVLLLAVFVVVLFILTLRKRVQQKTNELRGAKEKAEESEYKFSSLFKYSDIGLLFFDTKGQILDVNDSVLKIIGSPSIEQTKKINVLTFQPLIDVGFSANAVKCMNTKEVVLSEALYTSKWGKKVYMKYSFIPIFANNELTGVWVNFHDLTSLWNTQQELILAKVKAEESEERLNLVIKGSNDAAWDWDYAHKNMYYSPQWWAQIGYVPDELAVTDMLWYEIMHPEDRKSVDAIFEEALATDMDSYQLEFRLQHKLGHYVPVLSRGFIGRDTDNNVIRVTGSNQDLTNMKKTENELIKAKEKAEESEANITAIIEGNSNSIWAFNRDYEIIYINQVMQQEFLQAFGVLLKPGLSLIEALPEFLKPMWKPRYDRVLANEQFTLEDAVPTDNGTIYIEVSFNPIVKNGQAIGGSCFASNITSRKLAELELIEAKEKAEESDRLKSAFLANMSHEIRTPMNGILGFTSLLKEPNLSGKERLKFIEIIQKSGNRMLSTVNDIIDISRIESGIMELYVSQVNVHERLKDLFSFFEPEAAKKGIQLVFENNNPEQDNKVLTDPEKFNSIVTNLIKNAIKFTNEGTIALGYKIKKENGSTEVEFYVKDTGIGIPKDRQNAIFERFIQADIEDKMAHQGSGLGLTISKAYAEMLGGKIWLESEVGKGSIFYFTIVGKTKPESKAVSKDEGQVLKEDGINKNLKVLVVEDDETSRDLISIVVKKFAKEIINVRSGLEAVKVCRNNPDIDLVLMDIRLPGMNGYDATRKIREFNKDVIIISQTANALAGDREKSIEAGCNDYITKPFNQEELSSLIYKHLK